MVNPKTGASKNTYLLYPLHDAIEISKKKKLKWRSGLNGLSCLHATEYLHDEHKVLIIGNVTVLMYLPVLFHAGSVRYVTVVGLYRVDGHLAARQMLQQVVHRGQVHGRGHQKRHLPGSRRRRVDSDLARGPPVRYACTRVSRLVECKR